ncbi:hypothetical protein LCGC14_0687790 [marine sediment metagenome]|uniref:DUF2493 domain-containing protein n=1 Tax=marine sediment metagenome TaxID=412755 RepID=A0A0F9TUB8_9ZZZZ
MNIAIIGSRDFRDKELVERILAKELTNINVKVITGGARGVDIWVEEFCKKDCTPCKIIRPIDPANKLDYIFRNVEIITLADKIIAFWGGKSKGTKFVIDYAKARRKNLKIIKK